MKFKYKDNVKIKDGFYEGCVGEVRRYSTERRSHDGSYDRYQVVVDNIAIWIFEDKLEEFC